MTLSPDQIDRFRRHILLKEIGGPGVMKLQAACISIIGAGALGGPAALYLAAAGVGHIEIWDDDVVERSNLQRQIQFAEHLIGDAKAPALAERLRQLDTDLKVSVVRQRFDQASSPSGSILIDACDNFETRFRLNDFAHHNRRYLVSGAAAGWTGQVGVFASGMVPGSPCYRCWVPEMPPGTATCEEAGIVGAVTGVTGSFLALEAIKLITGAGDALLGRILVIDGLKSETRTVRLRQDPCCPACRN